MSQAEAGPRFMIKGFAEPTVVDGTSARWLRKGPGGQALMLVMVHAARPGFDRTGRVRWIVQTDGSRLPDGTPVATLQGVISRSDLWPSKLQLDPARFAGQDGDADSDGVPDTADVFPYDLRESLDTDLDGVGNNADPGRRKLFSVKAAEVRRKARWMGAC